MLINPERKNSLLGLELVVVFVGLLAHCFATIVNFQWFSKLPSPLNGMVEGNHWDQWFSDGFGVRQPLVTMVFDGCAPLVRRWNGYVPSSMSNLGKPFLKLRGSPQKAFCPSGRILTDFQT